MHYKFRNVNDAFRTIVTDLYQGALPTTIRPSRQGPIERIDEPVTVTYTEPTERVLFSDVRDANPFFHLFESLWMLAGRNDVSPLKYFNQNIANIASDDGKTFNGAYGYRWRKARVQFDDDETPVPGLDQLGWLAGHIQRDPNTRRANLQMWNVQDDTMNIEVSKDVCCNLSAVFEVETGVCNVCDGTGRVHSHNDECWGCKGKPHEVPRYLNMTVFNRSNDLMWGMLGANVVHFSFLQEYMASRTGLDVGVYHQISSNLHYYMDRWSLDKLMGEWDRSKRTMHSPPEVSYAANVIQRTSLVKDWKTFDDECNLFIDHWNSIPVWNEPFLQNVAKPMCRAFEAHKERNYGHAHRMLSQVRADDWRIAGTRWIYKRALSYRARRKNKKKES